MKITAILNQDAFIPCETRKSLIDWNLFNHQQPKDKSHNRLFGRINLILWYRDGVSLPFYTVDARSLNDVDDNDTVIIDDDHNSMLTDPSVKHIKNDDRFEFDLNKLTPLLRIRNVTEQDEGLYHCSVEYTNHRTFSTEIQLKIIGPPISIEITDSKGNHLEGIIGPYNEFQNITLICKVFGGNPKPNVIWYRKRKQYEEIIDDSFESSSSYTIENSTIASTSTTTTVNDDITSLRIVVVNILNLKRLDRNDYMASYVCRATNRFYYRPLIASITIDMNLMPLTVRIFKSRNNQQISSLAATEPIMANNIVEYGCRSEGSKPNANIEWFLDDERIIIAPLTTTKSNDDDDNEHYMQTTYPKQQQWSSFNNCIINDYINNDGNDNRIIMTSTSRKIFLNNIDSNNSYSNKHEQDKRCKFLSVIETHKMNSTLSIIRFIPDYSDNNRILSCQATNPFIDIIDNDHNNDNNNNNMTINISGRNISRITDKISLKIQYAPIVTITVGLPVDSDREGDENIENDLNNINAIKFGKNIDEDDDDDVEKILTIPEYMSSIELNCHIKANPWIDHVLWYLNNTIIDIFDNNNDDDDYNNHNENLSSSNNVIKSKYFDLANSNQTLILKTIDRFQHSGNYHCYASNSINESSSETIKLNVAYAPKCLILETQFLIVHRNNGKIFVNCQIDTQPSSNIVYKWILLPFEEVKTKKINIDDYYYRMNDDIDNNNDDDFDDYNINNDNNDYDQILVAKKTVIIVNDSSSLDLIIAINRFFDDHHLHSNGHHQFNQNNDEKLDDSSVNNNELLMTDSTLYSTLLLQCHAKNMIGEQKKPCSFMLHIYPGPPQKVQNCMFRLNKSIDDEPKALVECIPGNDGSLSFASFSGQIIHLIGLLSNEKWQKLWNNSLNNQMNDDDYLLKSLQNLISAIESMNETNIDTIDNDLKAKHRTMIETEDLLLYKLQSTVINDHLNNDQFPSSNFVQFQLDSNFNLNNNKNIDIFIYSKNSFGISEPLIFMNVNFDHFEHNDDEDKQATNNDGLGNQSLNEQINNNNNRKNWIYLRLKGLIVIFILLIIIAIGCAWIRRFLSTTNANNDDDNEIDNTHPHHHSSVLLALKQRRKNRRRKQNEEKNSNKNLPNSENDLITDYNENNDNQNRQENDRFIDVIQSLDDHDGVNHPNEPDRITRLQKNQDETLAKCCTPLISTSSSSMINSGHNRNREKNSDSFTLSSISFSLSSFLESKSVKKKNPKNHNDSRSEQTTLSSSSASRSMISMPKPIREFFEIIKRFMNRSIRNNSHYGQYDLPKKTSMKINDNFSVDFDSNNNSNSDYNNDDDDDGKKNKVSNINNHKLQCLNSIFNNKNNDDNRITSDDYCSKTKQQKFIECNDDDDDDDDNNDLIDTNLIVATNANDITNNNDNKNKDNENTTNSNINEIGVSFNKRMMIIKQNDKLIVNKTKKQLTNLFNQFNIIKQQSTMAKKQAPNDNKCTNYYSILPASILSNDDNINSNIAETPRNVQLLYVSQKKNLY